MQDFSPQGQDGVRCLVVAFLLRSSQFRFTFRCTLSSIGFFAGLSNGPDIGETITRSIYMQNDDAGANYDAHYGVGERVSDRVPVFRDEKGDPSTRADVADPFHFVFLQ